MNDPHSFLCGHVLGLFGQVSDNSISECRAQLCLVWQEVAKPSSRVQCHLAFPLGTPTTCFSAASPAALFVCRCVVVPGWNPGPEHARQVLCHRATPQSLSFEFGRCHLCILFGSYSFRILLVYLLVCVRTTVCVLRWAAFLLHCISRQDAS